MNRPTDHQWAPYQPPKPTTKANMPAPTASWRRLRGLGAGGPSPAGGRTTGTRARSLLGSWGAFADGTVSTSLEGDDEPRDGEDWAGLSGSRNMGFTFRKGRPRK